MPTKVETHRDDRKPPRNPTPDKGPAAAPPRVGEWLWTCRAGAERDLCEELAALKVPARPLQAALVAAGAALPHRDGKERELTFARQGFPVQVVAEPRIETLLPALTPLLRGPLAVSVFVPDSDAGNLRSAAAQSLQRTLGEALKAAGQEVLPDGQAAHDVGGQFLQVCLLEDNAVACGVLPARRAPSLVSGGRLRVPRQSSAPSRSALKLSEALLWLGHGPESGDVCVDLGAAPGGWSHVLLQRRCHVVAVDPGRLAANVAGRVEHLRVNAFHFEPELPADWVLCDMAYRPLEVAALLAKWGRRRWARFLLANIKLPMQKKVEMLARVHEILQTGGWTGLRTRQLYHDRDEVTVSAWRGFGIDTRPPARRPRAHGPREQRGEGLRRS